MAQDLCYAVKHTNENAAQLTHARLTLHCLALLNACAGACTQALAQAPNNHN